MQKFIAEIYDNENNLMAQIPIDSFNERISGQTGMGDALSLIKYVDFPIDGDRIYEYKSLISFEPKISLIQIKDVNEGIVFYSSIHYIRCVLVTFEAADKPYYVFFFSNKTDTNEEV